MFCCTGVLIGQQVTVWPGDVNNNGVVNGVDLLYHSWAEADDDNTGPARADMTTTWGGKIADQWDEEFPDGIDYVFADGDGDGEVDDEEDIDAIRENFGFTHGTLTPDDFSTGTPVQDPGLVLQPQQTIIGSEETLEVEIVLGSAGQELDDVFGLSFDIFYDPQLVNSADLDFVPGSWFGDGNNDIRRFIEVDKVAGRISVALAQKGQEVVSGQGPIAKLIIVMEDIVAISADTVEFELDSVKVMNDAFGTLPAYSQGTKVALNKEQSTSVSNQLDERIINLNPNPTNGWLRVVSDHIFKEGSIRILDALGRTQTATVWPNGLNAQLDLTALPSGIYFFELVTPQGRITKKFIKK